jgi:TRAP-type transport system periplasmic protein
VIENIDKAKFAAKMAPVLAGFEKQFGKDNIDRIRNTR